MPLLTLLGYRRGRLRCKSDLVNVESNTLTPPQAGGEYPVCGTGTAEASDESLSVRRRRGLLVAMSTDFSIDLGFVVAGVVAVIVLAAYNDRTSSGVWRVCFGLGIVLPLTLFFFRIRMIDSTQYRKHAMKKKIPYLLVLKRYWKPMLGTSLAWFMYGERHGSGIVDLNCSVRIVLTKHS